MLSKLGNEPSNVVDGGEKYYQPIGTTTGKLPVAINIPTASIAPTSSKNEFLFTDVLSRTVSRMVDKERRESGERNRG